MQAYSQIFLRIFAHRKNKLFFFLRMEKTVMRTANYLVDYTFCVTHFV